jgi:ABC-type sulfate transport system permease component
VFLELSMGRLDTAIAVSFIMIVLAVVVLLLVRRWGASTDLAR